MASRIAARRKTRPKSKRIPVQAFPLGQERDYTRTLLALVRAIHSIAKPRLMEWYKDNRRSDSHADAKQPLAKVISGIKFEIEKKLSRSQVRPGLIAQGGRVAAFNRNAMNAQFKAVLAIDPFVAAKQVGIEREEIEIFAINNSQLIESIGSQYLDEVQQKTMEALNSGLRPEDYAEDLQKRFDVTESRARLIARDQMGKLNGALTQARQTSLGIDRYIWRTAKDERVRGDPAGKYPDAIPSHFALEGLMFSWSDPPEPGHPGDDYQCRCRAEPVFPDDLDL